MITKFTKLILSVAILAIMLMFSTTSNAQVVRKIIVEEGTNTSCGPCAAQNPLFVPWLTRNLDRVIPIVYHAWWPGKTDVMYVYDTTMAGNRIRYYGIDGIGVPCAVMAGKYLTPTGTYYQGAPGDTTGFTNGLKGQTFYSPIDIKVNMTQTQGTGTVQIHVASTADFSNKKLRVVICEEHHAYSGSPNGETDFYYLARKMLPDFNGVDVSLNANTSQDYSYDFTVDASFADGLYAVAFVQDDKTKEILQAGTTMATPAPKEPDYSVFVNQYDLVFVGKKDDSKSMDLVLTNTTDTDVSYMLNAFISTTTPSDWTASIADNKYVVGVPSKTTSHITLNFTIGSTAGIGEANLNVQIQGKSITFESSKLIGISEDIKALHITGGTSNYSAQSIIDKTHGTGNYVDISNLNFNMAYPKLTNIKYIYWDGGTDGVLSTDNAALLVNAINNNIGVIITGEQNTPGFVNNGVMALFNSSWLAWSREGYGASPWPVTLAGVPGDFISKDFGNSVKGNLINWLLPLFKINDNTTTFPIMTFADSKDSIFALRTQRPNSRAVFLGINPFVINDATIREKLIDRSIQYIEYTIADVNEQENPMAFNAEMAPNPVSTSSQLKFNLNKPLNVKISVVNQLGQDVKFISEETFSEGSNTVDLQLSDLPNGNYFIILKSPTDKASVHFIKMK